MYKEASDLDDSLIGARVADYVIEDVIAVSFMGVIYRARQPDTGGYVAIKVLKREALDTDGPETHLFREAQALSVISHRGVIEVIQCGRLPGSRQFMVMEYLEGENLEQALAREGAMPVCRVIEIVGEILDALSAVHKAGVVHCHLKPSNVFLARQSDGTSCVKLLSFELAHFRALSDKPETPKTGFEGMLQFFGTPEYMAPEQTRGLAVTPRTDIYSLGVLTFEMLAGKLPFHSPSIVEMMRGHAFKEAPDIRDCIENIPNTLAELLASMLKKLPEERPRSADEAKQRLSQQPGL